MKLNHCTSFKYKVKIIHLIKNEQNSERPFRRAVNETD